MVYKSAYTSALYHDTTKLSIGRLEIQAALVLFGRSAVFHLAAALVKGRIAGIEVFGVEIVLRDAQGVAETIRLKH